MTNSTNRLDQIADRQRTARMNDIAFAAMILFMMVWSIASLGAA